VRRCSLKVAVQFAEQGIAILSAQSPKCAMTFSTGSRVGSRRVLVLSTCAGAASGTKTCMPAEYACQHALRSRVRKGVGSPFYGRILGLSCSGSGALIKIEWNIPTTTARTTCSSKAFSSSKASGRPRPDSATSPQLAGQVHATGLRQNDFVS
jgi:hypothetical protein